MISKIINKEGIKATVNGRLAIFSRSYQISVVSKFPSLSPRVGFHKMRHKFRNVQVSRFSLVSVGCSS